MSLKSYMFFLLVSSMKYNDIIRNVPKAKLPSQRISYQRFFLSRGGHEECNDATTSPLVPTKAPLCGTLNDRNRTVAVARPQYGMAKPPCVWWSQQRDSLIGHRGESDKFIPVPHPSIYWIRVSEFSNVAAPVTSNLIF